LPAFRPVVFYPSGDSGLPQTATCLLCDHRPLPAPRVLNGMIEMRLSESRSLGSFNPLILQLKLQAEVPNGAASKDLIGTFFHEHVHFWQSIATTYGIARHFEVLDWIAQAVGKMGGRDDLILQGLAKPVGSSILQHLREHRDMDAAYSSRPRTAPVNMGAEASWIELNEKTGCWEYVRWNRRDKGYFATPIGAHTIQENLAHVMEQIGLSTKAALAVQANAPSTSPLHVYHIATECFWNKFPEQRKQPDSLIVTMIAFLEACLQIPSTRHRNHPDYPPMTIPGMRFVLLLEKMNHLQFINHEDDDDYRRFIDELFQLIGWPDPHTVIREHLEWLSPILDSYEKVASEHRSMHPERFEKYVEDRLTETKRKMTELYCGTEFASIVDDRLREFERALRGSSIAYYGMFGLGLLEYIVRALRLRLDNPLWLVFMHLQSDQLLDQMPMPIHFYKEVETNALTPAAMALFNDLRAFPHLWAITLQWGHRHEKLKCGNRYFDIPCLEPSCRQGLCPDWTPGRKCGHVDCTFVSVLQYFGLWSKEERDEPKNGTAGDDQSGEGASSGERTRNP
jgi:hypothetical protein